MPFDTSHGERLSAERLRLGLSQVDLADLCGITRTMLSRYERAAAEPGASSLIALSSAGVDIQFVLTGVKSGASEKTLAPAERELLQAWREGTEQGRKAMQAVAELAFLLNKN